MSPFDSCAKAPPDKRWVKGYGYENDFSDQARGFKHQRNLCRPYDRQKLTQNAKTQESSALNWPSVIALVSLWQKRGPAWVALSLQNSTMAWIGHNDERSSRAILKISNGEWWVLSLWDRINPSFCVHNRDGWQIRLIYWWTAPVYTSHLWYFCYLRSIERGENHHNKSDHIESVIYNKGVLRGEVHPSMSKKDGVLIGRSIFRE